MHIRPYEPNDISAVADIMALNNQTDPLARFITRDIFKYPTSYRMGCLRFMKSQIARPGAIAFMAETDPEDYTNGKHIKTDSKGTFIPEAVGWCVWTREGSSPKAKEWQRINSDWYSALNRKLMGWEWDYRTVFTGYEQTFNFANRKKILPFLMEPWDEEVFGEAWEVNGLYVHRDWQKRGIGKRFLQWGKDRAMEEQVPVVVGASPVGSIAYRSAGFKHLSFIDMDQYFDVLEFGGERMQKMVWEPELPEGSDVEGNWLNRAVAKLQSPPSQDNNADSPSLMLPSAQLQDT